MSRSYLQKYLTHPIQGVIAHSFYKLLGLIPVDFASNMGGKLARTFGPKTRTHKIALDNLRHAFPEKSDSDIDAIARGAWENLGRTAFEFPHIPKMNIYKETDRFEVTGTHIIDQLRDDGKCGIFFSGHIANWEVAPKSVVDHRPILPVHLIFRSPNNPHVRSLFDKRKPAPECQLIPKGSRGARQALKLLGSGEHLAMLVDQKMNDGIAVPFFGRDAMSAPAIAQFALKYDCPMVPVRVERLKGVRFKIHILEPLEVQKTSDRQQDIYTIMCDINQLLEGWIKDTPDQWLWMHRRWPK